MKKERGDSIEQFMFACCYIYYELCRYGNAGEGMRTFEQYAWKGR